MGLTSCFQQHRTPNQLRADPSGPIQAATGETKSSSSTASPNVLLTFNWKSEVASQWQLEPDLSSPNESKTNFILHDALVYSNTVRSKYPEHVGFCPTSQSRDTLNVIDISHTDNNFHTSAVWLGRNMGQVVGAKAQSVHQPRFRAVVVPFTPWESEKSTLDWFVPPAGCVLHTLVTLVESCLCRHIGGLQRDAGGAAKMCSSFDSTALNTPDHSPGAVDVRLNGSVQQTDVYSRIGKSCSINFVIPGFMKCATSFLFEGTVM